MFVDGVMYGSGTSISVDIKNATNNLTVGGNVAGAGYWNGFISNVRVIKTQHSTQQTSHHQQHHSQM